MYVYIYIYIYIYAHIHYYRPEHGGVVDAWKGRDSSVYFINIVIRENGKGGMRKGGIGQVNRNTQQTNTNKLDVPIPPFLIPPFPISQVMFKGPLSGAPSL